MNNETRLQRLRNLREVVSWHVGQRGKPVRLGGRVRAWDMGEWDSPCHTSACALGNYALSKYGQEFFTWSDAQTLKEDFAVKGFRAGAQHFQISVSESRRLFDPVNYSRELFYAAPFNVPPSWVRDRIDKLIRRYERGQGDMQRSDIL